jgi:hypothetical protein
MSAETERSSTESCPASGLDFEDTALTLTLRLPGSSSSSAADADRKRGASPDAHQSPSLAASGAPPAPKCVPPPSFESCFLARICARGSGLGLTRVSAVCQGAGGGVAAREVVPQERARGRLGQGGGAARQVRQGGRRRRAVPAQGEPARLRRLRPPHPRAPGQVLLPLHNQ